MLRILETAKLFWIARVVTPKTGAPLVTDFEISMLCSLFYW